jgi:hypothetical protein
VRPAQSQYHREGNNSHFLKDLGLNEKYLLPVQKEQQ